LILSGNAQPGHLRAFQKGDIAQTSAKLKNGRFDEWPTGVELPESGVVALAPASWPPTCNVPPGLYRYCPALSHTALKAGEKGIKFAKAARQEVMHVTRLRYSRSKLLRSGVSIALDDRNRINEVA
jgi:hypothetical protein